MTVTVLTSPIVDLYVHVVPIITLYRRSGYISKSSQLLSRYIRPCLPSCKNLLSRHFFPQPCHLRQKIVPPSHLATPPSQQRKCCECFGWRVQKTPTPFLPNCSCCSTFSSIKTAGFQTLRRCVREMNYWIYLHVHVCIYTV